jgi:hypothetical protein
MAEQWNGFLSENDGPWRLVVAGPTQDVATKLLLAVETVARSVDRIVRRSDDNRPLPKRKRTKVTK